MPDPLTASAMSFLGGATGTATAGWMAAGAASAISMSQILSWGLFAGSFLYSALSNPKGVQGPRLTDFNVQNSEYGVFRTKTWGRGRVATNVIWMDDVREKKINIKAKKFFWKVTVGTRFEYYATWAVALGEGPISGVTRIWANNKLIYDETENATWETRTEGRSLVSRGADDAAGNGVRFYLGSDTQEVDSLIEAEEGVGDTTSFRNTPYIVFNGMNLTVKYGNAIPQISVEVVGESGVFRILGWDVYTTDNYFFGGINYAPSIFVSGTYAAYNVNDKNNVISIASPTQISTSTYGIDWQNTPLVFTNTDGVRLACVRVFYMNGSLYGLCKMRVSSGSYVPVLVKSGQEALDNPRYPGWVPPYMDFLENWENDGFGFLYAPAIGVYPAGFWICGGTHHTHADDLSFVPVSGGGALGASDTFQIHAGAPLVDRVHPAMVVLGSYLYIIGGVHQNVVGTDYSNACYKVDPSVSPATVTKENDEITGLGVANANIIGVVVEDPVIIVAYRRLSDDKILLSQSTDGATWIPYNDNSWTVTSLDSGNKQFVIAGNQYNSILFPGRIFVNEYEYTVADRSYSTSTDETTITVNEVVSGPVVGDTLYHYPFPTHADSDPEWTQASRAPMLKAFDDLFLFGPTDNRILKTRKAFVSTSTLLSDVVSDIMEMAGYASSQFDVTGIASIYIDGMILSEQTEAKDLLVSLMRAFHFDAAEYDGKIHFILRGGKTPISIDEDDLGAYAFGGTPVPKLEKERKDDLELPKKVIIKHYDPALDYQYGTQDYTRQSSESEDSITVNLPVIMSAAQAKKAAQVLLYDAYNERMQFAFYTTQKYAHLVPTDVVSVTEDGVSYTLRIVQIENDGNVIRFQAVAEDLELYDVSPEPEPGELPSDARPVQAETFYSLLDIPVLSSDEDQLSRYGFYFAAAPTNMDKAWQGASLLFRREDETFTSVGQVSDACPMGYASTVLAAADIPWVMDKGNIVDIVLTAGGTPETATEQELAEGANTAVIGNEIVQYKTVTSLGSNQYRLSDFYRGRYGTEWAMYGHEQYERFVDLRSVVRIPMSSEFVDVYGEYKVRPLGHFEQNVSLNNDGAFPFINHAIGALPLSVVGVDAKKQASGVWAVSFIRRSRLQAAAFMQNPPIGEDRERYEIDFYDDGEVVYTLRIEIPIDQNVGKIQFDLPLVADDTETTINGTVNVAPGQNTIYGGPTDSLDFEVFQIASDGRRGYGARNQFSS